MTSDMTPRGPQEQPPEQLYAGNGQSGGDGAMPGAVGEMDVAADAVGRSMQVVMTAMPTSSMAVLPAQPMNGAGTNFTEELGSLDFRKMLGGPLQAAVDAQVASSLATVNFINQVGFTTAEGGGRRELVMVDFSHVRKDKDAQGAETSKDVTVRVPLLAMLPIPSLRIEQVVVDFNARLNSVQSSSTSTELGVKAEVAAGWGPVNFKVSASYQRRTATNVEVKREYALNVNMKAVQDEIPPGLEKVLGLLAP